MIHQKSHSLNDLRIAQQKGFEIYDLDTGNDGEDDTLIGSYEECEANILSYHGFEKFPEHWELRKIDYSIT